MVVLPVEVAPSLFACLQTRRFRALTFEWFRFFCAPHAAKLCLRSGKLHPHFKRAEGTFQNADHPSKLVATRRLPVQHSGDKKSAVIDLGCFVSILNTQKLFNCGDTDFTCVKVDSDLAISRFRIDSKGGDLITRLEVLLDFLRPHTLDAGTAL